MFSFSHTFKFNWKICVAYSSQQETSGSKCPSGFLGVLAGLAAKALPAILGGLDTGLVSGGVEKAISGHGIYLHPSGRQLSGVDGLHLHKSGHCVKVEPIKGKGLQLTPRKLVGVHGDGLYLKRDNRFTMGEDCCWDYFIIYSFFIVGFY